MHAKLSFVGVAAGLLVLLSGFFLVNFLSHQGAGVSQDAHQDFKNATYTIDGTTVTLVNGSAETPAAPGSASSIVTHYFGNEATGDLNGDGVPDVAFLLTQQTGGSGTFYYAVAALKTSTGYVGTNAVLLGDRIAPQTTEIRNGQVLVNYATRASGEPMTASPSVGVTAYLRVEGTTLETVPAEGNVIQAFYSCAAGKTINAIFHTGAVKPATTPGEPPTPTGSVALTLSDGRALTLPQTISADGGRYALPDDSFVFWVKGNGALVLEGGKEKSYLGCITVVPQPSGTNLSQVYANGTEGFSFRLPEGYTTNASYRYQELGPGKDIIGTKFTIPASLAAGTNLAGDTYISVETIPQASTCTATLFLDAPGAAPQQVTDNGVEYAVASSTGAGAGNRYEETVYALPGTNPCIAVRYFIHYGVFENYPAGSVRAFDRSALLAQFDAIRRTLTIR